MLYLPPVRHRGCGVSPQGEEGGEAGGRGAGGGGQRPRTVVANPFLPELARPSRARCERQYWSHRVTALEPSISVNVFSETAELLAYYRIQMRSLKTLEAFFGKPLLLGGTLVEFFSTLAAAVMPPDDVPVRDAQLAL